MISIYNFQMEEKSKQIQKYLTSKANPIIQPMLEEMARQRPSQVLTWMRSYINRKIDQKSQNDPRQSSDDEQDEQEFKKKLERLKKNGNKKISRQGISAQVFGKFNQKAAFTPKQIKKDQQSQLLIKKLLEKSILFQNLNQQNLELVAKATDQKFPTIDQTIISQGEQGDALYIVASGEYDCWKVINGKQTYLKTYTTGQAFGELALMYNAPRAATIKCKTAGELFTLDRATFQHIVQQAATNKRSEYSQIISKIDILADVDSYQRDQICDALKEESFGPSQYVVRQGETGDKFYFIAQGQLIAEKKTSNGTPKQVFAYKVGEYFGQIALLKNTVRQASIKTITPCRLVWIDRNTFKRLLGPMETILSRNMEKYKKILQQ